MTANILDIGQELARFRKEQRHSQGSIAELLDTTQSHISAIERGELDSRFSTIQDYARALDLELMLIPRSMLRIAQTLLSPDREASQKPRFYPRPE